LATYVERLEREREMIAFLLWYIKTGEAADNPKTKNKSLFPSSEEKD
jgi:hypothetical protein